MVYYNVNTNEVDKAKVIQNITFNVTNAMATTGIQGYSIVCTGFDVPNMRISFEITHIGYPVEILFYTGSVFKREKEFSTTYKTTLDIIKDPSLTPQQRQDAVDAQIAKTNTSIAMMIYDQIKTHQVLKSFEKLVHDKYMVPKNFPSPEQMWEEFKAFYEAVKSIPSPIPFPCTIADWWNHLEQNIIKNTALMHCSNNAELRRKYGIERTFVPTFFTVLYDQELDGEYYENLIEAIENHPDPKIRFNYDYLDNLDNKKKDYVNELNGIPAIVQTSIPTAQPQQTAV